MQKMLDRLRVYAQRKGLTVNTAKSEVVHFNCTPVSPLQNPFTYDGVILPEKDRFKCLGMLLDKKMDLKVAEEHAVRPYMAAQKRISEFAKGHDLKNRPHAMLWLSKMYGSVSIKSDRSLLCSIFTPFWATQRRPAGRRGAPCVANWRHQKFAGGTPCSQF